MKTCPNCKSEVDDHFELCWNCNFSFSDIEIVEIQDLSEQNFERKIDCLRCNILMEKSGNFKFLEGVRTGLFGNIFELLQNRESFDLYHCLKCGKVEFFIPEK